MRPADALGRSRAYLDEATENLTFDEFGWALEELWRALAWALCALTEAPSAEPELGPKGRVPPAGSLRALLTSIENAPTAAAHIVGDLERWRAELADEDSPPGEDIERWVFESWRVHDACARRLELLDPRVDGAPGVGRRAALKLLVAGAGALPLAACERPRSQITRGAEAQGPAASKAPARRRAPAPVEIASVTPLDQMHWPTRDPFLFCAHHRDDYPEGDAQLGPAASLQGRHLGRDFEGADGWRMYHGRTVPGFPRHPHRGFETVTVVREGMLDHADSMGAAARYGSGDVQWLTAGGGIQHAEMFPLLREDAPNPLELFQIWLNLPRADKMVDPHFTMLWSERIPRVTLTDEAGHTTELTLIAGAHQGQAPPSPPPDSWASRPESDLAIWTLRMDPGARLELPAVAEGTVRSLYVHRGKGAHIAGRDLENLRRAEIEQPGPVPIQAGPAEVEILLLQGRPISEPVAKRGPFVMNTQGEIRQAYLDYRRTQFGGWPWRADDPVHASPEGRFARHIDGRTERPG